MLTVLRVVIMYFAVLVGLRLLGKREFGQMTPIELISLLLVPEIISQAILGEDFSMTNAIIGVATLFSIIYLMTLATFFSNKLDKIVDAQPVVLVQNGTIIQDAINRERVPVSEIYSAMHKVGLERMEQVKWVILENDGKLSIIPDPSQFIAGNNETNFIA